MEIHVVQPYCDLISFTTCPVETIERAGRTCYNTEAKCGQDASAFVRRIVASGHESVVEHASATFNILCSRSCMAQLTRHRVGISFSVRSQRYVDETIGMVVLPPMPRDDMLVMTNAITVAYEAYTALLANGIRKEDARFVLPNATATVITMTANFRELRHIIKLRTSKKAQWEIRFIASEMLRICTELWPSVFGDLSTDEKEFVVE